jgi:hypothetical protein
MTSVLTRPAPAVVHRAFLAWLGAIAAGVVETVVYVGTELSQGAAVGGLAGGVALRAAIYTLAVWTFLRMRAGRNWARIALTVLLGGLGTLSLVIEPISWLAAGNSLGTAIADASASELVIAASRTAHVLAVLVGVVLMYRPAANRYFRRPVAH